MKRVGVLGFPAVLLATALSWPASATAVPASMDPLLGGLVTVKGVVEPGVETGCLLLVASAEDEHSPDSPFLLLGGDKKVIVPGAHLTVTGELPTGVMSPCKQGKPLRVKSAEPSPV